MEIVELCSPLKGKERSRQIEQVIKENLVPVKRSMLYKLLKNAKDDGQFPTPDQPWGDAGRPALLSISDMKLLAQNLKQTAGKTVDKEIENAIIQKQQERAIQQGLVPITTPGACPDPKTVRNYKSLMASLPDISVIRNAVPKTQTRYTAENSWMSSVCFMVLVAATHFIPLSTKSNQYEDQQKGFSLAVGTLKRDGQQFRMRFRREQESTGKL